MWTDTHCHLQFDERGSNELTDRAAQAGVSKLICVGTDLNHSREAIDSAQQFENVWATVGLHPHDAKNGLEEMELLISQSKVVAIGECGLDYFYEHSPRDIQREIFARQIKWAHQYDKALIVHTRDAWDDTFDILSTEGLPERTIIHCFTGGLAEAKRCLDVGAFVSFSGIITFKKADDVREAAQLIPLDRMLVETDSPFLSPVPFRGKPNEPAHVTLVGEAVAAQKNESIGLVAEHTTANAVRVFALT